MLGVIIWALLIIFIIICVNGWSFILALISATAFWLAIYGAFRWLKSKIFG